MTIKAHLFIRGPIPLLWIQQANAIGHATGVGGVALWFYVGLNGGRRTFKLDSKFEALTRISRQTRQKCLRRLSEAGLICLQSSPGCYPEVTIYEIKGINPDALVDPEVNKTKILGDL